MFDLWSWYKEAGDQGNQRAGPALQLVGIRPSLQDYSKPVNKDALILVRFLLTKNVGLVLVVSARRHYLELLNFDLTNKPFGQVTSFSAACCAARMWREKAPKF